MCRIMDMFNKHVQLNGISLFTFALSRSYKTCTHVSLCNDIDNDNDSDSDSDNDNVLYYIIRKKLHNIKR